jgi:hypothetical protein
VRAGCGPVSTRARLITAVALAVCLGIVAQASAERPWGLTTTQTLVPFTSTTPVTVVATRPLTGLPPGDRILAIAITFNGRFVGLGRPGRLYVAREHVVRDGGDLHAAGSRRTGDVLRWTPFWSGGHASAGAIGPATEWFLAEGATGSFFDTFVLAANPTGQQANVTSRPAE